MTDKLREQIVSTLFHRYVDANAIGEPLEFGDIADAILPIIAQREARARADALDEAAKHLIDEDLDNAEVCAAAIRALKDKP
jgi:hypothetical protein